MLTDKSKIIIFIDEERTPIAELQTPVQFELNTKKLVDGEHVLRIVSKSPTGREGIRKIKFMVRNGPAIAIEGLKDDKGNQKKFMIEGSETPQSIPSWLWMMLMLFLGWAIFYAITNFNL
jgi:hypothetical protein